MSALMTAGLMVSVCVGYFFNYLFYLWPGMKNVVLFLVLSVFFAFNELLYSSSKMLRASKGLEIGNNIIEIN